MTDNGWRPIRTAPVGETILLCNAETGLVSAGYGEWFNAPMPRWIITDQSGFARAKMTHWQPLPAPAKATGGVND